MTWKEFKKAAEKVGAKDEDNIINIFFFGLIWSGIIKVKKELRGIQIIQQEEEHYIDRKIKEKILYQKGLSIKMGEKARGDPHENEEMPGM
jgi:hypothetical protein